MSGPDQGLIYEALVAMLESGATPEAIALHPALTNLEKVQAIATDDGRRATTVAAAAGHARSLLRQATETLNASQRAREDGTAVAYLLGLVSGTQAWTLSYRLGRVASLLRIQKATLTQRRPGKATHVERLCGALAAEVVDMEIDHISTTIQSRIRKRREPAQSLLGIDWLCRFEEYYRLWTPLSAIYNDVRIAVHETDRAVSDARALSALYAYVDYSVELELFIRRRGGLWLTPNKEAEQLITNQSWQVIRAAPFVEIDNSALRRLRPSDYELASFAEVIRQDSNVGYLDQWKTWCYADHPSEAVRAPERMIDAAKRFCDLLDSEWDSLADWYSGSESLTGLGAIDVMQLHRQEYGGSGKDE